MTDQPSIVLATEIVTAWLANPHTRAHSDDVRALLTSVNAAVRGMINPEVRPAAVERTETSVRPAVSARASLKIIGRIISMIDGKPYASLMRHLKAQGLTPDEYRKRFSLPASYPMVAPAYSEARSVMAKKLGLGRKATSVDPEPEEMGKPSSRKTISEAKKAARAHLGIAGSR